jgi:hypothetical protein
MAPLRLLTPALLAAAIALFPAFGFTGERFAFGARGRLGIELLPLGEQLRAYFEIEGEAGVLVSSVDPAGAGAEGGLRAGDVITRAGDERIERPRDLIRAISALPEGKSIELDLVRRGASVKLSVTPRGSPGVHEWNLRLPPPLAGDPDLDELRQQMRELRRRVEALEERTAPDPS